MISKIPKIANVDPIEDFKITGYIQSIYKVRLDTILVR